MDFKSKSVYSRTVTNGIYTLYKGQAWVSFLNTGSATATIKSYNDSNVETGSWSLPAGSSYNLGESNDGREWGKFVIDATGTVVEATFENANISITTP